MSYFDMIDAMIPRLKTARTPDEVIEILGEKPERSGGEAFWSGDGDEMLAALYDAGWRSYRYRACYYWVLTAPNGEYLSYTEGDVSRGDNPMVDA